MSFVCATCGRSHDGVSLDTGFQLPDEVWAMPERERADRAHFTSDLGELEKRFFLRGFLAVPLSQRDDVYGWGVWVEVDAAHFQRYLDLFESDASDEPLCPGVLSNELPTYPKSAGLAVLVQFGRKTERPSISFPADAAHRLAQEQRQGMSEARLHEILISRGEIEGPNPPLQPTGSAGG